MDVFTCNSNFYLPAVFNRRDKIYGLILLFISKQYLFEIDIYASYPPEGRAVIEQEIIIKSRPYKSPFGGFRGRKANRQSILDYTIGALI